MLLPQFSSAKVAIPSSKLALRLNSSGAKPVNWQKRASGRIFALPSAMQQAKTRLCASLSPAFR